MELSPSGGAAQIFAFCLPKNVPLNTVFVFHPKFACHLQVAHGLEVRNMYVFDKVCHCCYLQVKKLRPRLIPPAAIPVVGSVAKEPEQSGSRRSQAPAFTTVRLLYLSFLFLL